MSTELTIFGISCLGREVTVAAAEAAGPIHIQQQ